MYHLKKYAYRHSTYHLKAHRISNNMVLKLPAQRQGGGGGGGGGKSNVELKFDLKIGLFGGTDLKSPLPPPPLYS